MPSLHKDVWLGIATILFGAMLLVYAIPQFISAPSNVRKLVLSPLLWPTIIAWLIILLGAALIASRMLLAASDQEADANAGLFETREDEIYAWIRLGASALLMIGLIVALPVLGMVPATGIAFALFAVIIMTPRPLLSLAVAVALPLVLYFFFAHVAGVSVPQGRFLSLP